MVPKVASQFTAMDFWGTPAHIGLAYTPCAGKIWIHQWVKPTGASAPFPPAPGGPANYSLAMHCHVHCAIDTVKLQYAAIW